MNTSLHEETLHTGSTAHPPDAADRQILTIPDHAGQAKLTAAKRLSFRLGLWLLERSLHDEHTGQRPEPAYATTPGGPAFALLSFDPQQRLR